MSTSLNYSRKRSSANLLMNLPLIISVGFICLASAEEKSILDDAILLSTNIDSARSQGAKALIDGNFKTGTQTLEFDDSKTPSIFIDLGSSNSKKIVSGFFENNNVNT